MEFLEQAAQQVQEERLESEFFEADGIYLFDKRFQIPFIPCPRKLDLPFKVKVLACGANHSLVLAESG